MATDTRNLHAAPTNDADFRAWGSGLSAQLLAMGLVKTTDTGQIDWTTVLRPAALAYAGYEIWRFNDALQATKPVHIKLQFGMGPSQDRTALTVQVGLGGTNGAGALVGTQVSAQQDLYSNGTGLAAAGALRPSYVSGNTSRLAIWTNVVAGSPNTGNLILVERFKKSDGVETDEGVYLSVCLSHSAVIRHQPIYYAGTIPVAAASILSLDPNRDISNVGNAVFIAPHTIAYGEPRYALSFAYKLADLAELQAVTVAQFGSDRIFLPIGRPANSTGWGGGSTVGVAMPWE